MLHLHTLIHVTDLWSLFLKNKDTARDSQQCDSKVYEHGRRQLIHSKLSVKYIECNNYTES